MVKLRLKKYGTGQTDGNIPAAGTVLVTDPIVGSKDIEYLGLQVKYVNGGAGGTSIDAYVQTSFDDGQTWWDIINLQVLVATVTKSAMVKKSIGSAVRAAAVDKSLAANSLFDGFFGDKFRIALVIVGAYNAADTYEAWLYGQHRV